MTDTFNRNWKAMDPQPSVLQALGRVVKEAPVERTLSSDGHGQTAAFTVTPHVWLPRDTLRGDLPVGFQLRLECLTGTSTRRRFRPTGAISAFVLQASLGGHAILAARRRLDRATSFSLDMSRLLYQKTPRLRDKLCRTFRRTEDLYLSPAQRSSPDQYTVLPEEYLEIHGSQTAPDPVAKLMADGIETANRKGWRNPPPEVLIRLGLLDAARLAPLDPAKLTSNEIQRLLRIVLFDVGQSDSQFSAEVMSTVTGRLLRAMERHIDDDTEDFSRWFFEEGDNIVHQIAKQRKGGGPIDRGLVREALAEIVFQSIGHVGNAVHAQMREFAAALSPALNASERLVFDAVFQNHAALGGLPLIALHEWWHPLREALFDIWEDPGDTNRWGAMLRFLYWHSEMIRKRREADRTYKRRKGR